MMTLKISSPTDLSLVWDMKSCFLILALKQSSYFCRPSVLAHLYPSVHFLMNKKGKLFELVFWGLKLHKAKGTKFLHTVSKIILEAEFQNYFKQWKYDVHVSPK